jgi:hypothetical protein
MATTTNFGWETPDDTDLVKDGALAMRTLGNSIDTSFVDLKGGTTGQILSKASNTDLDYTWINNDQGDITAVNAGTGLTGGGTTGAVTLTNDMATTITAAGDIVLGTGSGTYDNLPIGTTGQILTADTTVSPYKVKWATPASSTPSFVGCSLTKSAAQTVSNNTFTAITFDTETFDTDAFHSTSSNTSRITIPTGKGGKYLFVMSMCWTTSGTGERLTALKKNGNYHKYTWQQGGFAGGYVFCPSSVIVDAVDGDYFEMFGFQKSGGNLDIVEGFDYTTFSCTYLGA